MGQAYSYMTYPYAQEINYARFIPGTEEEGYSAELVNTLNKDEKTFKERPDPSVGTIWQAFEYSVRRIPDESFLGSRDPTQEGAPYVWKTWRQVQSIVNEIAAGYQALNLLPEVFEEGKNWKFMGIYAKNREEWVCTHMAAIRQRGTSIAFYDTLGPAAVEFVIRQTRLATISCALQSLRPLIMLKSQGRADSVQNLISFDVFDEDVRSDARAAGLNIYHISEVIEAGKAALASTTFDEPEPQDVALFCYTSGTTGDPKAAKLTHANLISVATGAKCRGFDIDHNDTTISYLPLAHSFEQMLFVTSVVTGAKIGYFGGDVLKLTDDCQVLKPTLFPSVPRIYNRIFDKIQARLSELTGMRNYMAQRAIQKKLFYLENYATYNYGFYDRIVCNKFRAILGGNVRIMATGSAPIAVDVLNFLKVCFCCPILEGYGQTESTAASCVTLPEDATAGHVGGPLPCLKVRLRDIPEMGYTSRDQPYPRGEICFAGPSVFAGYFMNEEKNKEALVDGWLMSGDVGIVLPNGSVRIIDRAKNIFKLAQGEYIAPEKLENVYTQSPLIDQIHVHGDSLQSFLVAIIVPDFEMVKRWINSEEEVKVGESEDEICQSPDVSKQILLSMNELATANKFNGLERIKKVFLTSEVFTEQNGLMTPSQKLKRNVSAQKHRAQIDQMYGLH